MPSFLFGLFGLASVVLAQTQNCVLEVPANPLSAKGLATPYKMSGCDQTQFATEACFVEAAILDPATGAIQIYNPLVINKNSTRAGVDFITPVVPTLPANAVVGIFFGSNAVTLTLSGDTATCVNGDGNSVFGQFAYCNTPAFFKAAYSAVSNGLLKVPPPGKTTKAATVQACPVTRDFRMVDMDQSDNVDSTYLLINGKTLAQNTAANAAKYKNATREFCFIHKANVLLDANFSRNPERIGQFTAQCIPVSHPRLYGRHFQRALHHMCHRFLGRDGIECMDITYISRSWADQIGNTIAILCPSRRACSGSIVRPLPHPMTSADSSRDDDFTIDTSSNGNITQSLTKTNLYRAGVGQPQAADAANASAVTYCTRYAESGLFIASNEALFTGASSPAPGASNNLFTFMANRFATSFGPAPSLGCQTIFGIADSPVNQTTDGNGVVIAATINTKVLQDIVDGKILPLDSTSTTTSSVSTTSSTSTTSLVNATNSTSTTSLSKTNLTATTLVKGNVGTTTSSLALSTTSTSTLATTSVFPLPFVLRFTKLTLK
jgi:hypothetical protein